MKDIYHIDYETYSNIDLPKTGVYKYAHDASTEILIACIAKNKEPVKTWVNPKHDCFEIYQEIENTQTEALNLFKEASGNPNCEIWAHNANFERILSNFFYEKYFFSVPPELKKWHCTMSLCNLVGIPIKLEKAAEFLKLPPQFQKDKRGILLINKFSKPSKKGRTYLSDSPNDAINFVNYCIQDVITERKIHDVLGGYWENLQKWERDSYFFSERMNDRGIPIDIDMVYRAMDLSDLFIEQKSQEFRDLTGINHTQRNKVLEWLNIRGYTPTSLTASVIKDRLENGNLPNDVKMVLNLKQQLSFAAIKKLNKMETVMSGDKTAKGCFMWSGAQRTRRWSGSKIQPQNFKRPTDVSRLVYNIIKDEKRIDNNFLEFIKLIDHPLKTVSEMIRFFIHKKGSCFLNADYSSIEARVNAWVSDHVELINDFNENAPIYEKMASYIFEKPLEDIDAFERQVGKTAVLGCGYGMGNKKFYDMCSMFGIDVSESLAERAVKVWRSKNTKIVYMWNRIDLTVKACIKNKKKYLITDKIGVHIDNSLSFPAMFITLPSGHKLCYPYPEIRKTDDWRQEEIVFQGKAMGVSAWSDVGTYGAKLLENIVQALAGDILSQSCVNLEKKGYRIFMVVHDEILAYDDPGTSVNDMIDVMCKLPHWANGLPLSAEGATVDFYQK